MKKGKKIKPIAERIDEEQNAKNLVEDRSVSQVSGGCLGMANPVAGMSRSEAEAIAMTLGEGEDMGSWKTMGRQEFLNWWAETNNQKLE